MGRMLGIDYGQKRVGVALSDPLSIFATGLTTLENRSDKQLLRELKALIETHDVEIIVIGLPLKTTGEKGATAEAAEALGERITAATACQVFFEDERYSSVIANQSLREQGIQPSRNKGLTDKTAAALILQQYLDRTASSRR